MKATDLENPQRKGRYHHGDLREALLVAAEQELIDKGSEGFTLRGAAKRAGVSHAAPAHHFKDTNALLTALAARAAERLYKIAREEQARADPAPRAQMLASGLGYVKFAVANPALFNLLFTSQRPNARDEHLQHSSGNAFTVLLDSLAAIIKQDPMATEEGARLVVLAWASVHGLATLLIFKRLDFLKPQLDRDFDATLWALLEKVVPHEA